MRITNNMLITNMVKYLSDNLRDLSNQQAMSSSGKVIQRASENPIVAARALKLTTNIATLEQYGKNAQSAGAWMTTTETAINSINQQLQELRPLAVQASNGTLTAEDRQAIASQIKQIRDEVINLANSTYTGRHIFSGYKSDTPLLDENGFFNVAVTQLEKIYYEVGVTNKIQVNITGDSVFNLGESAAYLPARSALVQDIDDFIAMIDAQATVTSSKPLNLSGPGIMNMSGAVVDITFSDGSSVNVNFDEASAQYVNQMTSDQVIDHLNKKIGLKGTASLDVNGDIVLRDFTGGSSVQLKVADSSWLSDPDDPSSVVTATGSAARLFGAAASGGSVSAPSGVSRLTGTRSMTQATTDISGYAPFQIVVDRESDPITINLSSVAASVVADPKNARLDEIARAINAQIAAAMGNTSTATKWAKCTVEDGRLCLTSESFGSQSYIELCGGQEIKSLFGAAPTVKQGNVEQQGKLVGSRDFREPVADVTQFSVGGAASSIRVVINGTFNATIQLDDGDPAIDPKNMTLRQIMGKIDEQMKGYATCDIDGGKLVLRAAQGGVDSKLEMSSLDEDFYSFLFGENPVVRNGANDPTHGSYRSGVSFKSSAAISLGASPTVDITFNGGSDSPVGPVSVAIPNGPDILKICDGINERLYNDPATQAFVKEGETNNYAYAILVNRDGDQLYPPINGNSFPDNQTEMFLVIQSPTWGTGSSVKIEINPPSAASSDAMSALFGVGTINAPVVMGGVDGVEEEACVWLDTLEAQLGNLTRVWTDLGARMNRVELTQNRIDLDSLVMTTLQSQNEDVNAAYALTMLQSAETVYNTSLAVGARVIQPSLLDFLR